MEAKNQGLLVGDVQAFDRLVDEVVNEVLEEGLLPVPYQNMLRNFANLGRKAIDLKSKGPNEEYKSTSNAFHGLAEHLAGQIEALPLAAPTLEKAMEKVSVGLAEYAGLPPEGENS